MTLQVDTSRVSLGRWTFRAVDLYVLILLVWALYLCLAFSAPVISARQQSVSTPVLLATRLIIGATYLLTWLAAGFSFVRVRQYAASIQNSQEWRSFYFLSLGLAWLLISLLLSTVVASWRTSLPPDNQLRAILTILTNYLYVVPYLVAFCYFFRSSQSLSRLATSTHVSVRSYIALCIPLTVFAYFWLESVFSNPFRNVAMAVGASTYYLPDHLLVLTIIVPSLATWFLGAHTLMYLQQYYRHVKGVLYRRALTLFLQGIAVVILGSILLQSALSLGTQRLYQLSLLELIGVLLAVILMQALGFALIARGAHKLARIEAV